MGITTYSVIGMTCQHCVSAVTDELRQIRAVTDIGVDLVPGGTSTVTVASDAPVETKDVAAALNEAGDYHIATP